MKERIDLHNKLCEILGNSRAYFQPPESMQLKYPCIVYSRNSDYANKANNKLYMYEHSYQLIYITDDGETDMPLRLLRAFPKCRQGQPYPADNLYHFPFDLYY